MVKCAFLISISFKLQVETMYTCICLLECVYVRIEIMLPHTDRHNCWLIYLGYNVFQQLRSFGDRTSGYSIFRQTGEPGIESVTPALQDE